MHDKPILRIIRNDETPRAESPPGASVKPETAEAPVQERVPGRRLLAFLTNYADAIDQDIQNILDL